MLHQQKIVSLVQSYYGLLPTMLKIPAEITNNYSSFPIEIISRKNMGINQAGQWKMCEEQKVLFDISAQYLTSIVSGNFLEFKNMNGSLQQLADQVHLLIQVVLWCKCQISRA